MSRRGADIGTVPTPTSEPQVLYAGDTWSWQRALSDYPASDWTLKYTLINSAGRINITAGADGDVHEVEVPAATTAGYAAGVYTFQAFVEQGSERYTVGRGSITVLAGYASGSGGADARSQAQIALDAAVAAYAAFTASSGLQDTYTIAGRSMKFRSVDEIVRQINFWRNEVAKEQAALGITPARTGKILTRFGS